MGVLLAAALLGGSAGVLTLASPASADVCDVVSGGYEHPDGIARVDFRAERDCTNNSTRVVGTLSDVSCDDRSVNLEIKYSGGYWGNHSMSHDGGCNTALDFDVWSGDLSGESVEVCLMAFNGWPWQSSEECSTFYL
jgi:hypothetical protein